MEAAVAADRPTRFAADLLESAAVQGRRESRSAKQQLDHWARVGRAVSMHESAARRRVEAALAGELALSELDESERLVANAELDVAIQLRAGVASFGERLAAEGVTTVALADDGTLVEHRPDGSVTVIAGPTGAE
jgi:hypothetical protein